MQRFLAGVVYVDAEIVSSRTVPEIGWSLMTDNLPAKHIKINGRIFFLNCYGKKSIRNGMRDREFLIHGGVIQPQHKNSERLTPFTYRPGEMHEANFQITDVDWSAKS